MSKPDFTIVKVGGRVVEEAASFQSFLEGFVNLQGAKILVHGGGVLADALAERLGVPVQMHEGRRITDSAMREIVQMVYGGLVNKNIVAALQARSCQAIGLTGADADCIRAVKRPVKDIDYGWVGDVVSVQTSPLLHFFEQGIVPVLSPLSHDGQGQLLNTNADTIAAEVAQALSAHGEVSLMYCFDKPGVMRDLRKADSVIPYIRRADFEQLKQEGIIHSGMLPKLQNAFNSIEKGVSKVWLGQADALDQAAQQGTWLLA